MSESAVAVARIAVTGRPEERFFAPLGRQATTRTGFLVLLAGVFVLHVAGLAWLFHRDSETRLQVAEATETPIEVIQEPPPKPPEPEKPEPEPKKEEAKKEPPKPEPDLEKPATSAPRAPSEIKVDTAAHDAKTEAPKAAMPPRDGQPAPATTTARTPAAAPPSPDTPAKALEDDKREAEALDKAEPVVKPTPTPDATRQLSGLLDAPSFSFAAATAMAPFPAGNEDNRYMAVIYGMVMSKNRYVGSAAARRGARGTVSVSFVVDPIGRLHASDVMQSSGQSDLDALAMAAVKAAAPYPPPPGSGPMQLLATITFGGAARP